MPSESVLRVTTLYPTERSIHRAGPHMAGCLFTLPTAIRHKSHFSCSCFCPTREQVETRTSSQSCSFEKEGEATQL